MKNNLANDRFSPSLVKNAEFDGKYEIPLIKNDLNYIIPNRLLPFDKRNSITAEEKKNIFIHFFIYDRYFRQIVNNPFKYAKEIKEFLGVITPDFSIYRDMPIAT